MVKKAWYFAQYLCYEIFVFLCKILPKNLLLKFIDFFANLALKLAKKYNKIAMANLNLVFQNSLNLEQKNDIILQSYKNLAINLFEFTHNHTIKKAEILQKSSIKNADFIANAIKSGRKIIFITAHYGVWELALPYVALMFDVKINVVNQKLQNPYINEIYKKVREKNNISMIERDNAAKDLIKAMKNGEFVTFVIDQSTQNGCEIDFLGIKDIATDVTSKLALKFNALIVPVFVVKNSFLNYEIEVKSPIDVLNFNYQTDDKIKELTQFQNDLISEQIFKAPQFWLWQHKRFKKYYKNIYD